MADPRYLEWKRLAAEGGVVVVSILLAFWIDASWDGFVESRREQDQLAAMRAEFASSVIALDEIIAAVQMHADGIGELIALLKAAGTEPVRVPGELLGCAIGWRRPTSAHYWRIREDGPVDGRVLGLAGLRCRNC